MTPIQQHYENTARTIFKSFEKRGFEGYYCETSQQAVEKAMSFIQPGMTVSFGGSVTLTECGVMQALKDRDDITLLDRYTAGSPEELKELFRKSFACDYYFMSTNSITLDGELLNTDGSGNRMAAFIYGPENVVIIAGMNKVVADLEAAQSRLKTIASGANCVRLNRKTPCASTGVCHDCYGPESICSNTVITRRSPIPGRIKIILVGETLGY